MPNLQFGKLRTVPVVAGMGGEAESHLPLPAPLWLVHNYRCYSSLHQVLKKKECPSDYSTPAVRVICASLLPIHPPPDPSPAQTLLALPRKKPFIHLFQCSRTTLPTLPPQAQAAML